MKRITGLMKNICTMEERVDRISKGEAVQKVQTGGFGV